MKEYAVHALALAGFFGVALCRECSHVHWRQWSWELLKHTVRNSYGETCYLFAVHVVVYSGLVIPQH